MGVAWSPPDGSTLGGWRAAAACRSVRPDVFFPIGTTIAALRKLEVAKAVCGQCPVRDACLDFALRTRQDAGVWGGYSEDERVALRRARRTG